MADVIEEGNLGCAGAVSIKGLACGLLHTQVGENGKGDRVSLGFPPYCSKVALHQLTAHDCFGT